MTQQEAFREVHERVRQCFARHKFVTFGDAMGWWQQSEYDDLIKECAEAGMSTFSTDINWLTSQFGPQTEVDHKVMGVRKIPKLTNVKPDPVEDQEEPILSLKTAKNKKRSRRRRF